MGETKITDLGKLHPSRSYIKLMGSQIFAVSIYAADAGITMVRWSRDSDLIGIVGGRVGHNGDTQRSGKRRRGSSHGMGEKCQGFLQFFPMTKSNIIRRGSKRIQVQLGNDELRW